MKNFISARNLFFAGMCLTASFLNQPAYAMGHHADAHKAEAIVKERDIKSIQEVLERVEEIHKKNPEEKILVVFDWDRTLSLIEGCFLPLREGEKTKNVVNNLLKYNAHPIILTSRRYRLPGAKNDLEKTVKNREKEFDALKDTTIMKNNDPQKMALNVPGIKEPDVVYNNRFVAAAPNDRKAPSVKGYALENLIDQGKIEEKIKYIVFVDNDEKHIENVKTIFEKRNKEKVDVLHYPVREEEGDTEDPNRCQVRDEG
jgi:hypothetical protein